MIVFRRLRLLLFTGVLAECHSNRLHIKFIHVHMRHLHARLLLCGSLSIQFLYVAEPERWYN